MVSPFDPSQHYLPLLNATVNHAFLNTTYYHEAFSATDLSLKTLANFSRLPVLTRSIISERSNDLIAKDAVPDFVRNTSGSTFGTLGRKPLITYRSYAETDLWRQINIHHSQASLDTKPLMLRLLSLDHGLDIGGAGEGVFPVPLEKEAHFHHIADILTRDFSLNGYSHKVKGVVGSLTRVKLLTILLMNHGYQDRVSDINFLGCHSQLLTSRWRNILKSFWKVDPTEYYGISEIPGLIGSRCETCGYYHLSPTTFIETLSPDTYEPVVKGPARLVATALYPLIKSQPLIRYDTEDIVEVIPGKCPASYLPSLEYIGRENSVLTTTDEEGVALLLNPMALHNILDQEPSINVEANARAKSMGVTDFGFLKYHVQHLKTAGRIEINVDIELRWHPREYSEEAIRIENRIKEKVYAAIPALKRGVENKHVHFKINMLPSGSLTTFTEV